MHNKFKLLVTMGAFCFALGTGLSAADASVTVAGKIASVRMMGSTYAVITLVNAPALGRPACHSGWSNSYAFDLSTNKGRALLSSVQAVLLAGKDIYVEGGSTCTTIDSASIETVQTITF